MSEKITFQELIESIADQTNNSKQLTHDFLKDFVAVINSGLESDGTISIAGFGKFKLRPMDEREGYNPQTGEKITIPAHNKVVFKPYKGLRELVNAPYKHLEAELLDEDTDRDYSRDAQKKDVSTSASSSQSGLHEPELSDAETEQEEENNGSLQSNNSEHEEGLNDSDIVEYSPDIVKTDYEKYQLASSPSAKSEEYEADERGLITTSSYSYETYQQRKKKKRVWLSAAACLVLLLSAGAWYFSTYTDAAPFDLMTISFSKTSADTHLVSSTAPGQINTSDSSSNLQIRGSEYTSSDTEDLNNKYQKQASTKQIITKGQTLWSLADQQYDNPYLWPWIYDENKSSIKNPDLILAGQTLALPLPSGFSGSLTTSDSLQIAIGYIETYRWYKEHGYSKAKYYLYAARVYSTNVFDYADVNLDDSGMVFTNSAR